MKLTKGNKYDTAALQFTGWTAGDGSSTEGYNVADYFDRQGSYLGADNCGIEPEFVSGNPTLNTPVEITTSDDHSYRATLTDGSVSIAYLDGGTWIWAGDGKWEDGCIQDCPADLGDEAYELLDDAIATALTDSTVAA